MSNNITEKQKLNIENLKLLERKIEINEAKVDDYLLLETFLASVGLKTHFLLDNFKRYGVYSYEQYILERSIRYDNRNKSVDGVLLDCLIGTINALEKYLDPDAGLRL